jgi:hypothetical protein
MWPCMAVFFGTVHSRAKWPERPQLKQVWTKVAPAVGGASRRITGAGAGTKGGGEPTTIADANAGAVATVEVGRWGHSGTPSGTSEEHYRMEQTQPSSSWFPCGRIWHHP